MTHRTNPTTREDIAKRLARVAGHANSLKRLWDEDRHCDEMLTQIAAVRAALDQVDKVILEHHIEHCVTFHYCHVHQPHSDCDPRRLSVQRRLVREKRQYHYLSCSDCHWYCGIPWRLTKSTSGFY